MERIPTRAELSINGSPVYMELSPERGRLRFGLLGPLGTYTDDAADLLLNTQRSTFDEEFIRSNPEVVRLVDRGEKDLGIVAVENAIEGNIMETLREIVRAKNATILGEGIVKIDHMLIGNRPGDEIRKIYSHPQALGQCSEFISANYPNAELVPTTSTTRAVEEIINMVNAAAIANRRSAGIYRMPILAESIGDNPHNTTRFWLIGRGETQPTGEDTTSLVFTPKEDYPGILWECLGVFKEHGINLTKIDSHPTGRLREYIFLASLDGHKEDDIVKRALSSLLEKQYCSSIKILGSYGKAQLPEGVREPGAINGGEQSTKVFAD